MNFHKSTLENIYYQNIRDGIKIYEIRVNDERRQSMNKHDIWYFSNNDNYNLPLLRTQIVDKTVYSSFREALIDKGIEHTIPNANSLEEAINIYENLDNGNYKINAQKYGVVCFELMLIS